MRRIINNYLQPYSEQEVALLFSGGLDSLSILFSCLDLGIKPHLYTFKLDGYDSEDYLVSKRIAKELNLELTEVVVPHDTTQLVLDVFNIIKTYRVKKKTQVQCIHPFLYIVENIKEPIVLTGLCADDLYGSARKMQEIGRKDDTIFYQKRLEKHLDATASSYKFIKELFTSHNKTFIAPYKDSKDLSEFILNKDLKELHSPKQKNIMYIAYKEELDRYSLYRRNSNLQINSHLREFHDNLLLTDLNTKNYKSVTGVYNTIYRDLFGGQDVQRI